MCYDRQLLATTLALGLNRGFIQADAGSEPRFARRVATLINHFSIRDVAATNDVLLMYTPWPPEHTAHAPTRIVNVRSGGKSFCESHTPTRPLTLMQKET